MCRMIQGRRLVAIYLVVICRYVVLDCHWSLFILFVVINQELNYLLPQRRITALRATVTSGCSIRITVMPSTLARTSTTSTAFKRPRTSVRIWVSCFMHESLSVLFIWSNDSPLIFFFFSFMLSDAELLTIKSKGENDFVSKYMSDNPSVTSYIWLGLNFNTQGKPCNLKQKQLHYLSFWVNRKSEC